MHIYPPSPSAISRVPLLLVAWVVLASIVSPHGVSHAAAPDTNHATGEKAERGKQEKADQDPTEEAKPKKATSAAYMRVLEIDESTTQLQLATRFFVPKKGNGPTISLVSAVHVADASFYEAVQSYLDAQDLVLFEGVGPPNDDDAPRSESQIRAARRIRYVAIAVERYQKLTGSYPPSLADT